MFSFEVGLKKDFIGKKAPILPSGSVGDNLVEEVQNHVLMVCFVGSALQAPLWSNVYSSTFQTTFLFCALTVLLLLWSGLLLVFVTECYSSNSYVLVEVTAETRNPPRPHDSFTAFNWITSRPSSLSTSFGAP